MQPFLKKLLKSPDINKDTLVNDNILKFLNITQELFKYTNLPNTITHRDLEFILQTQGFADFRQVNGVYYAFRSSLGGKPGVYYLPTISIVANPALNYSEERTIDEDCYIIKNDSMYQGLMPLITKYAVLLADCELSLKFASSYARAPVLIYADNDKSAKDAALFLDKIDKGDKLGVVGGSSFFEGVKTFGFGNPQGVIPLIELNQYIKAQFFMDLGIQANYSMKREAINESEATMNVYTLMPLVDNMLRCRQEALQKINAAYSLNISVELNSAWKKQQESVELLADNQEAEDSPSESE